MDDRPSSLTPPSTDSRCPRCASTRLATRDQPDSIAYGEGPRASEIQVIVPLRTCESCGLEFLDEAAEELYHDAVCRHLGVLTPREIRSIRKSHGLTRKEFARLTHIGPATLARWERGAKIQNAGYDRFLRLLSYPDSLARLHRQGAPLTEPRFRVLRVTERHRAEQRSFSLCAGG